MPVTGRLELLRECSNSTQLYDFQLGFGGEELVCICHTHTCSALCQTLVTTNPRVRVCMFVFMMCACERLKSVLHQVISPDLDCAAGS